MSELHRRALSLLPSDSHDAGRLLAVSGLALGTAGNYDGAKNAFLRGLAIARREESISLELLLLVNIAQVDMFHLRWQESLEYSLQAIRLSEKADELTPSLRGHYCAGNALLQFGNPGEAQRHSDSLLDVSAKLNDRLWLTRADLFAHRLSHLMGDFKTARDFSDRAVVMSPSYVSFLAWRIQMEYQLGEFSQGKYYLDQLLEVIRQVRPEPSEDGFLDIVIPVVAQITGSSDRLEIAEKTAHAILSSPAANPDRVQCARLGLALLSVQQGDATSAAEQYAYLESTQGQMAKAGAVSIPRVLGLLAHTIGQPELAASHFNDALAFCRKAGYQPELAWTCFDYATFLYNRHEHKRALLLLSEAVKICAELGMRPLMDRVNSLRESMYAQQPNTPKYPVGLTERQVQILRLIAAGKTNREIANDLVLSERTVHRHVAEIYAKIGARNRAEATVFSLSQLDPINQYVR